MAWTPAAILLTTNTVANTPATKKSSSLRSITVLIKPLTFLPHSTAVCCVSVKDSSSPPLPVKPEINASSAGIKFSNM